MPQSSQEKEHQKIQAIFRTFPQQINELIVERECLREERDRYGNGSYRNDATVEMAHLQHAIFYRIDLLMTYQYRATIPPKRNRRDRSHDDGD